MVRHLTFTGKFKNMRSRSVAFRGFSTITKSRAEGAIGTVKELGINALHPLFNQYMLQVKWIQI